MWIDAPIIACSRPDDGRDAVVSDRAIESDRMVGSTGLSVPPFLLISNISDPQVR
jgi:hypothetical protein